GPSEGGRATACRISPHRVSPQKSSTRRKSRKKLLPAVDRLRVNCNTVWSPLNALASIQLVGPGGVRRAPPGAVETKLLFDNLVSISIPCQSEDCKLQNGYGGEVEVTDFGSVSGQEKKLLP